MASIGKIARRTFLIGSAALAGGVAIGAWYVSRPYPNPLENDLAEGEVTFNPYIKIAPDNTVTVIAPRAEMGQGISTTLAAFVAEELGVDLAELKVEHGPASFAYFNAAMMEDGGPFPAYEEGIVAEITRGALGMVGKVLGLQGTGGSSSARDGFERMREAGAAARHVLVAAASAHLDAPAHDLSVHGKTVVHEASGRSVTFGEIAADAAKLAPPAEPALKDRADWTIIGKPQMRVDMLAKVTGAPIFGIDVVLPDMLFGTVRMNPIFGAKPRAADLSKAQAVAGVVRIVPIDTPFGHGFGVIATSTWAAFKAAEAIEADWGEPAYPPDSAAINAAIRVALDAGDGSALRDIGDVDIAFADAPRESLLEAEYSVPFLAHACMEPMNATARFRDGKLDIWSGNQVPTLTAYLCASALGIDRADATVHTTHLGGGFGRRTEADFSIYAALLAREADGRPVKVTWSREEDIRHDTYRPAAVARLKARLGNDGVPEAYSFNIAAPSIIASTLGRMFPSIPVAGPDLMITQGAADQPYDIANYRVTGSKVESGVPVGIWRSVGNSHNTFFQECFLDEVAQKGGIDPLELRRRLARNHTPALGVIDKVSEMAKWGEPRGSGRAQGFAFSFAFGSWVAAIVEVADTPEGIRIEKAWVAVDVGIALDPGIIERQVISAAIFGFSGVLTQEITIAEGMVEQSNFHDFDAMRIFQTPAFEVSILEKAPHMGGVGEIGTPAPMAALVNAVCALKGRRFRTLPLSNEIGFV